MLPHSISAKENNMLKSWMWFLTVAASLWIAGAKPVFAEEENETKIKFADAPTAVQKTLKRESAAAAVDEIEKETEDGKTEYEAEIAIDGKVYVIKIAEDGTLLGKNLKAEDDEEVTIRFVDAPAAVQKTMKREALGVQIATVKKETADGKTTYEALVQIDGKMYEIEVAQDGILQEKKLKEDQEVQIKFSDCPAAVQKTLKREANGAKIEKVDLETAHGKPVYEVDVKIDGRNYEILVAEDGLLLSKALDEDEGDEKEDAKDKGKKKEKEDDDDN
jgi:uncharacterized membrane protein YkoI